MVESVCEAPSTSIHRRSQQLNISETSLRLILHKDLGMTLYKVQLVQELKSIDHPMRFRLAKWACDRLTEDADFGKKIIFSIEAHFDLGGHVNKHNCRICGTENPHAHIEPNLQKTSRCLMRILVQRHNWASKMTKERPLLSMAIIIGPC